MGTEARMFNTFTAWFDSDLINVDDPQAVEDAMGAWANDLISSIPMSVPSSLRCRVCGTPGRPPPSAGSSGPPMLTGWLADGPTEQTLKNVLEVVVADLKGHQAYAYGD